MAAAAVAVPPSPTKWLKNAANGYLRRIMATQRNAHRARLPRGGRKEQPNGASPRQRRARFALKSQKQEMQSSHTRGTRKKELYVARSIVGYLLYSYTIAQMTNGELCFRCLSL
jgi:hypothetical protein